ncbi:MAG: PilT protein domain protein [Pelosinus sp.]|jgi:predicted nucleic acid-binding protein|nr:PilT protein domain protein [Pelosinus sp.]
MEVMLIMNQILIDTSILISHLEGQQATTDFLRTLTQSDAPLPALSVISEVELYTIPQLDPEMISKLLATVNLLPLSSCIAQKAGNLKLQYPEITTEHAIVAATALTNGFALVTFDVKAYKMIPGLIIFNVPNE